MFKTGDHVRYIGPNDSVRDRTGVLLDMDGAHARVKFNGYNDGNVCYVYPKNLMKISTNIR